MTLANVGAAMVVAVLGGSDPNPGLQLFPNVSNLGEGLRNPLGDSRMAQWLTVLSRNTPSLEACGALCVAYRNASAGSPLNRCRSFTRYVAPVAGGAVSAGWCFGHLDPIWLPLSGLNQSNNAPIADSGFVEWPCASEFDCSHNGDCLAGVCRCSQGWTGRRCERLDLLPVDRKKYGFTPTDPLGANRSSWGGSVLSVNGVWHMWAARMDSHCGIGQWEQNSMIVHATATDVLGPYTEREVVAGVFAHEPCVTVDRRTGELLMVSVNYPITGPFSHPSVFNASGVCNCTAKCTQAAMGSRNKCGTCSHPGSHPFLPILRTAPSVAGPWTETLSPVLGDSDSNLACWINGTGALNCNCRGGGICAFSLDWKNFSSWTSFDRDPATLFVSSRPDDEDPMLWQDTDTGVWHSIQHNLEGPHMCQGQLCQVGTHQFSLDGRAWWSTGTAYTNLVEYTDGSSHLFDRRERPHMVFAENSTVPVALSNAVRPGGADGDRTFTLLQGLRGASPE